MRRRRYGPRRPADSNPFASEAEVAARVREALEALGWVVYPEAGGFDLLAVAGADCASFSFYNHPAVAAHQRVPAGSTLGVETKLDAGTLTGAESLLRQVLPEGGWSYEWGSFRDPHVAPGPHYRAAASWRIRCREVLERAGVAVWEGRLFVDQLRHLGARYDPRPVVSVPEIVVEVPAGVPSPQKGWSTRVLGVRNMMRLRAGEELTSADFGIRPCSSRDFLNWGWAKRTGRRRGGFQLLALGPCLGSVRSVGIGGGRARGYEPPPDEQWPEIAAALAAKDAGGEP